MVADDYGWEQPMACICGKTANGWLPVMLTIGRLVQESTPFSRIALARYGQGQTRARSAWIVLPAQTGSLMCRVLTSRHWRKVRPGAYGSVRRMVYVSTI